MAQINIEPKPRRSAMPLLLGLLLVAAIAAAIWYFMLRTEPAPAVDDAAAPAALDTASGM